MSLDRALARQQEGNLPEAERLCRQLLREQPQNADALHLLGILALQAGQPQAAIEPISQSLDCNPEQPVAHMNLGVALQQSNHLYRALDCFERALQLAPENPAALNNHGHVLLELHRPAEALRSLELALQFEPNFPLALNNLGNALKALDRPSEALERYERALRLQPDFPLALNNRGNVLRNLGRLEAALGSFEQALRLEPGHVLALYNRGNVLLELERADQALASYQAVLRLRPGYPDALFSAAMTFIKLKRFEEAQSHLRKLLKLEPQYSYAQGYCLHARLRICDWAEVEGDRHDLVASVLRGAAADVPFSFLAVSDCAAAQLQCARRFVSDRFPARDASPARHFSYSHQRIRLAYVSGDLRNHIVARLLVGMLERHDRECFEVNAISFRPPERAGFGQRVHDAFDRFIDVSARSDADVAAVMKDLEIDIAVDLAGFTEGQRTDIFARRAAPVQVNYLGFPGTMGAPYMDYIIADEFVIPPPLQLHYAEQVVYLPDCFHPIDDRRAWPLKASRAQFGLPDNALVCCSLNNSYKYSAAMLDLWLRVVQRVPEAVLWLLADDASTEGHLRQYTQRRGLRSDRLVLSRRVAYEENLARLSCADLFLDTLPFNAGATASDVLWTGVPLLTCAGEAFASRMAGSLLRSAGLAELIALDLKDYERRALQLLGAPARLSQLRLELEAARKHGALFDTERNCRHLEAAFQIMWQRAQRGEAPSPITVIADTKSQQALHG
jgi:protein O-GlcNAc transferase